MPTAIDTIVCASDHAVATIPNENGVYYRFDAKASAWTKHLAIDPTDSEANLIDDMDGVLTEVLQVIEGAVPMGALVLDERSMIDSAILAGLAARIREVLGYAAAPLTTGVPTP